MVTIFNVTALDFITGLTDREVLRFLPSRYLKKDSADSELIKRIFTEDIIVNPEPEPTPQPVYPDIIQQLIDANPQPQTADDVAKILSLYNPDDISAIIQQLIKSNPQPTTAEQIAQNENILAYPYETNSAIYDYKYLNWSSLGDGYISRDKESYYFTEKGIQHTNIFPSTAADIRLDITITPSIDVTKTLFYLYTNLSTTGSSSTYTPHYALTYNADTDKYQIARRSTNNGTVTTSTEYGDYSYNYTTPAKLTFRKYDDGSCDLFESGKRIAFIASTSSFKPRTIRINFSKTSGITTTSNNIEISYFKLTVNNSVISQWNK